MYLNAEESRALAAGLSTQTIGSHLECVVFPTLLSFVDVQELLAATSFAVGVQNVHWVPKGAYTGAVSALLAKEAGAKYALIGHSESRYIFGEKDSDMAKKVDACDEAGLIPVVCIGETKEDLDEGKRQYRLKKQIESVLFERDNTKPIFFAYEPVWAISSSTVSSPCLPDDAEDIMGWIKQEIKQYTDTAVPVLYGGSVTEKNCVSYLQIESGDGVLIGSASSRLDSFSQILDQASNIQ